MKNAPLHPANLAVCRRASTRSPAPIFTAPVAVHGVPICVHVHPLFVSIGVTPEPENRKKIHYAKPRPLPLNYLQRVFRKFPENFPVFAERTPNT
jgi:hypothetical protein